MTDTILEFDTQVRAFLDTMKDVSVYESVRDDGNVASDADDKKAYIVYFGNDIVRGSDWEYGSIVGAQNDALLHPFGVFISAPSAAVRNAIIAYVRKGLLGKSFAGSGGVVETGEQNTYGDTDNTLKPTKFTYMLTFSAIIDRSEFA